MQNLFSQDNYCYFTYKTLKRVIVKGETMYSYGETERQCVFYGETMYFYGKHNLYLNIKKFFLN
jgi:hypothetical protein